MQLLIDIADIHGYRERCETWAKKRMAHIINNSQVNPATGALDREKTLAVLEEFDRTNPYPSLLPTNV